jgi:LAGLIDADG DNA endonuclease family
VPAASFLSYFYSNQNTNPIIKSEGSKGPQAREARDAQVNSIVLTSLQKDVFVGTLLGVSSMERDKPTHQSRVRYDQTYPGHKEYLLFLYDIFKDLTGTPLEFKHETLIREQIKFIQQ